MLRLPPLETGRAPLSAPSLSPSRTTRLLVLSLLCLSDACVFLCQFPVVELLAVTHRPFSLSMDLLMAEQVNQRQVAVAVFAPLRAGQQMVDLQFFLIEEGVPTFWTPTVLSLGQLLFGKGQVSLQWHLFGRRGGEAQDEAQKTSAARRVLEERKRPVLKTQWSQRQSCRGDACENGYGSGDVPTKECSESTGSHEKR